MKERPKLIFICFIFRLNNHIISLQSLLRGRLVSFDRGEMEYLERRACMNVSLLRGFSLTSVHRMSWLTWAMTDSKKRHLGYVRNVARRCGGRIYCMHVTKFADSTCMTRTKLQKLMYLLRKVGDGIRFCHIVVAHKPADDVS